MPSWFQPVLTWAFILAFAWFFVAAYRKARRKRRAEFVEEPISGEVGARAEDQGQAEPASKSTEPDKDIEPETPALPEAAEQAVVRADGVDQTKSGPVDERLTHGVERTRSTLMARLASVFAPSATVDTRALGEIEEALLLADVGVHATTRLVGELREQLKKGSLQTAPAVRAVIAQKLHAIFERVPSRPDPLKLGSARPHVILFVGVNGVGKTTTIGKVAAALRGRGHSVVLAAGDTFRAAAVEQLGVWAERTGCELVRGEDRADPASVIFRAIEQAVSSRADVVLADTAGRLHTKTALMDELKKVQRAAAKARAGAPDQVWLVLDATTGQNAISQAREFHDLLNLDGVILTKLDGTAKGGVVIAIADALRLPVIFVGVGETSDDLRPFVPRAFVDALLRVDS